MGYNMSWILVDGIDQDALYEALDLAPTDKIPHWSELGTSRVPLAGATLKSGWCAVFAKYALVMDITTATEPLRLTRLPERSRSFICVKLEHAMVSYSSLWQGGRYTWQIRHDSDQGVWHLEISGDLPPEFAGVRDTALQKQRAEEERREPAGLGVDYVFDVPLDVAAMLTGFRYGGAMEPDYFRNLTGPDFFRNLRILVPTDGNVLTKLSQPPKWWQTVGSMKYE
jgi:hypothetical protein